MLDNPASDNSNEKPRYDKSDNEPEMVTLLREVGYEGTFIDLDGGGDWWYVRQRKESIWLRLGRWLNAR